MARGCWVWGDRVVEVGINWLGSMIYGFLDHPKWIVRVLEMASLGRAHAACSS